MAKVLYIDHDMERIIKVQEILGGVVQVEIAMNGWEGLAASMMYTPDLVLINLMSKVMDGREMVRLLRTEANLQALPVLGFTVPSHKEMEAAAIQVGCTRIVEYPFGQTLEKTITQLLPPPKPPASQPR